MVGYHTHHTGRQGETFDGLVWLGAYEAKAGMAVRLVEFRVGATLVRDVTTITDPYQLSMRHIARLYARSFDSELAFLTLKRKSRRNQRPARRHTPTRHPACPRPSWP